jgi:Fe2+ transport system protein B
MDGAFTVERAVRDTVLDLANGKYDKQIELECLNKKQSEELLSELKTLMLDYPEQMEYADVEELTREFNKIPLFNSQYQSVKLTSDDGFYEQWHKDKRESRIKIKEDAANTRAEAAKSEMEDLYSTIDAREIAEKNKTIDMAKKIARHYPTVPSGLIRKLK